MKKTDHLDKWNINQPLLPVIKKKFDLKQLRKVKTFSGVLINERIVEVPFVLNNLSKLPVDAEVLDVGCAESILPIQMASLGYRVWGIDLREYPYEHPNFTFRKADACTVDFGNIRFDVVSAVSALEHFGLSAYGHASSKQRADVAAMENFYRLLKKGGVAIITVPFGVKAISGFQRIYDREDLDNLFCRGKFTPEVLSFSVYRSGGLSNPYWEIVSCRDAEKIASPDRTNAVALCVLRK